MSIVEIEASPRESKSKGYLNQIRSRGLVPGVVYGKQIGSVGIEFEEKELDGILRRHGRNTLIDMRIKSNGKKGKKYTVMVKELQYQPMKNQMLHVDFQQISLKDEITTTVGLAVTGEAPGVKAGGHLSQTLRQLEVSCRATAIPDTIEVDVSGLDIGDALHVSDLTVPEGVRVLNDPETLVISVAAPRRAEETAEAAEGETAEAGEAAPAPEE